MQLSTDQRPVATRHCCGLTTNAVLKFASSLLLPLALGIFTVVITFQQQQAAKQQRDEDQSASQLQRDLERNLSEIKYMNELLDTYVKDMGVLLARNNGSLTSNEVTATLARVKTLNIFRRLDSQRNTRIIRFLHEARQFHTGQEHRSLDLSTAELDDIDFRDLAVNEKQLNDLSFTGIFLSKTTCINTEMDHVNFTRSHFENASFAAGILRHVSFSHTHLENVDFSYAKLDDVDFSWAVLKNVSFFFGTLEKINFSGASLSNVNLSLSWFENVRFLSTQLNTVDFSFSTFLDVRFSHTKLFTVEFRATKLRNASFSNAQFQKVKFPSAILSSANLIDIRASETDFEQITAIATTFNDTILSHSTFMNANLKKAAFLDVDLVGVNFSGANLYKASFKKTDITDNQLRSALSIEGTTLSNETITHDINLVSNGHANCKITLVDAWTIETGNVTAGLSSENSTDCRFTLQSLTTGATMLQRVDLSSKWNSEFWPHLEAVLTASISIGVCIQLREQERIEQLCGPQNLNSTKTNTSLALYNNAKELEVRIVFNALVNGTDIKNSWCDNVKLFIIYGTRWDLFRVPMRASRTDIPSDAKWNKSGQTVSGQNFTLSHPFGVFVTEDQTIYVADWENHRIVAWKEGETQGQLVAGGDGNGAQQMFGPTDVIVDEESNSFFTCEEGNRRVVRWPRRNSIRGETMIANIDCFGLTMDEDGSMYVTDFDKHEVRRYRWGDPQGTVVAGGNGEGDRLDQLDSPNNLFVDREHSVFVSDTKNHRVMKWTAGAKEGVVVAGFKGQGNSLSQLAYPSGVLVDQMGTVYIADRGNNRVVRWPVGAQEGLIVVGGNDQGRQANTLNDPIGLSFDRYGHLYVVDSRNNRVQKFILDISSK